MWVMGILIVAGSAFPTWIPFDTWFGVTASVAGVAFGAGLMIAGFDPVANVSWGRALILYAILQVIYQIFLQISLGRFDIVSIIITIIAAVLLRVLSPNNAELWFRSTMKLPSGMAART